MCRRLRAVPVADAALHPLALRLECPHPHLHQPLDHGGDSFRRRAPADMDRGDLRARVRFSLPERTALSVLGRVGCGDFCFLSERLLQI